MDELKHYLEQMTKMRREMNRTIQRPDGVRFDCFEELVLTYGQPYQYQPRPSEFESGVPKQCYANSAHLAMTTGLIYVEGFGTVRGVGLPILHAWCVRPGDDKVIDVTTDNIDNYFGIPFDTDYVTERWANANNAALIDCWEDDYPLMFASDERMKEVMWAPSS